MPHDQDETRKRALLLITFAGVAASAISIPVNLARAAEIAALGNGVTIAVLILNVAFLLLARRTTAASIIGLGAAASFLLWGAPELGIKAYFWVNALPPLAFFLLGPRGGAAATGMLGALVGVQLWRLPTVGELGWVDVSFSYALVSALSFIGEHVRSQLQAALERESLTDGLTGLANRRACDGALHREASLAARSARTASIVLFDVDRFKTINDRFGHAAGDAVLRELGAILHEELRVSDVAGRWGGEELICVLPETDAEGARTCAERIRRRIRAHTFPLVGRVTVSAGVAPLRAPAPAIQTPLQIADWVGRADAALYVAKHAGRDRVEVSATVLG